MRWINYMRATLGKPPRPLLVEALPYCQKGLALDIGCGAGNETRFLLSHGYGVDSLDSHKAVLKFVPDATICPLEEFNYGREKYTLINAQYSLPFCRPSEIAAVMERIKHSLTNQGILVGQFFGPEDTWSKNKKMTFVTETEARALLAGLEVIAFELEKYPEPTVLGEPHQWHLFNFIARK